MLKIFSKQNLFDEIPHSNASPIKPTPPPTKLIDIIAHVTVEIMFLCNGKLRTNDGNFLSLIISIGLSGYLSCFRVRMATRMKRAITRIYRTKLILLVFFFYFSIWQH